MIWSGLRRDGWKRRQEFKKFRANFPGVIRPVVAAAAQDCRRQPLRAVLYDAVILVGWKRSTHLAKKALFSANVKLKPSHMDEEGEEREMKEPFRRLIPDLGLSVC